MMLMMTMNSEMQSIGQGLGKLRLRDAYVPCRRPASMLVQALGMVRGEGAVPLSSQAVGILSQNQTGII